jgi:hypothetical protein
MSGSASLAQATHWRRYRPLYLLIAVCLAPVIASYLAYYVVPPEGRTNYGDLITPQRPVPAISLTRLDGTPFDLQRLRGRWVLLAVDSADCASACQQKLWKLRQVRLTTGKDRDRVERVLLITDAAPLETMLLREYDGTLFLRAPARDVQSLLQPASSADLAAGLWVIDPLGNLMLRWPPDADPNRMKRDLSRLLRASRVG